MQKEASQTIPSSSDTSRILLLADDGRMASLLQRSLGSYPVQSETNVLRGIMHLSKGMFHLVMLNVESLQSKASEAVKAIRSIHSDIPILLYGEPFVEHYGSEALRYGANDFLVWPDPGAEIRNRLCREHDKPDASPAKAALPKNLEKNSPSSEEVMEQTSHRNSEITRIHKQLISDYHHLAQLIPYGKEILIQEAQDRLAKTLQVQWIQIKPAGSNGVGLDQQNTRNISGNSRTIKLAGPLGPVGEMELGPSLFQQIPDDNTSLVNQAGAFIGTLIYLAQRDASLKYLATVDELTGAYNRRYMEHFLREVIERNQHEHTEVTLFLFDIDEFKHYNDTYGHSAGDTILQQITQLMKRCCRSHDVVTRMGGDEFAVIFWDAGHRREVYETHSDNMADEESIPGSNFGRRASQSHPETVLFLSNRFRRIIQTSKFSGLGPEARGVLTISGGLARYPFDGRTVKELLAKADDALLQAKRSGKNRIHLVG